MNRAPGVSFLCGEHAIYCTNEIHPPLQLKEGPGIVPLVDATVFPVEDSKERKFCFLLQTPAKEYQMSGDVRA